MEDKQENEPEKLIQNNEHNQDIIDKIDEPPRS